MKSIKEVMDASVVSPWRGSEKTAEDVREQVRERYGDEVADEFDPASDAMPLLSWARFGYRVKRGERSLRSITFVEVKNDKGEVEKKYKRIVHLFHRLQVEKSA
ncbi:MAG TPA: hypothetical protein VNM40_01600 [Candidatus Paceibacterota bacterium]|nr:hypothetical protein [Candidatus Paceibacterota bacterium]